MGKAMDAALKQLEQQCPSGIASAQLLAFLEEQGIRFSEATLRKWVQLGLLPRSVRVGTKGKHQGSHGLYPVRVVRQILRIREMMARDLTIEEIQRQFLFVRGDIEALQQTLDHIFEVLGRVSKERGQGAVSVRALGTDIGRARTLANELLERLEELERRLSDETPTERERVVAS